MYTCTVGLLRILHRAADATEACQRTRSISIDWTDLPFAVSVGDLGGLGDGAALLVHVSRPEVEEDVDFAGNNLTDEVESGQSSGIYVLEHACPV